MSDDLRFEFGGAPLWRKGGKQVLQGTDFIKMESNHHMYDRPLKLNWQFKSPLPLIFDWNSRFCVEGEFQTRETEADAWQTCTPNESANVMVQPNWWGILVKKLELFDCEGSLVHQHNEPFHVRNHLEQFLYWGMDPVLKKQLCSEESHPGYSIPNKKGDWTFNTSETASSWHLGRNIQKVFSCQDPSNSIGMPSFSSRSTKVPITCTTKTDSLAVCQHPTRETCD